MPFVRTPKPSLYTGKVHYQQPKIHELEINDQPQPWQKEAAKKAAKKRRSWDARRLARETRKADAAQLALDTAGRE